MGSVVGSEVYHGREVEGGFTCAGEVKSAE